MRLKAHVRRTADPSNHLLLCAALCFGNGTVGPFQNGNSCFKEDIATFVDSGNDAGIDAWCGVQKSALKRP